MVQSEGFVRNTLCTGLKPQRRRLARSTVPNNAGRLENGNLPIQIDTQNADVEFACERSVGFGDCFRRGGNVGCVGFVKSVIGLNNPPFRINASARHPFRLDGDQR